MSCQKCYNCKNDLKCFWDCLTEDHYKEWRRLLDNSILRGIDWARNKDYTTMAEYTMFGNQNWSQIKKENMTKRERFLKAGGLFEKEKKINRQVIELKDRTINVVYIDGSVGVLSSFITKLEIIDNPKFQHQDKDYPNQKAHFENILSNTKSDIWIASRDQEIKISDLADKHLVNIMRYLVAHWMEIKQQSLIDIDTARNNTKNSRAIANLNTAYFYVNRIMNPSGLDGTISCFNTLIAEFNSRFGYDSLNSIYEGN